MGNPIFKGSAVAIVTPMNSDGSVNYEEYGKLIDFQINNGTDAIVACGTTGESATLTREEHCEVIKYTVEKVNKRVPVIAGTGSNDTVLRRNCPGKQKNSVRMRSCPSPRITIKLLRRVWYVIIIISLTVSISR